MQVDNVSLTAHGSNNHDVIRQFTSVGKKTLNNDYKRENKEFDKNDVKKAVEQLNEISGPLETQLRFVFHEELNEYYVSVVNPLTDEVIKEIPPKKMLDMYAAMVGFMGILIDEKI